MEQKSKVTSSEIKDFIQEHLGFTYVEDVDDLRSDLRLGEARIDELIAACNARFEAQATKDHLQKVKQLVKRVKNSAKVNCTAVGGE